MAPPQDGGEGQSKSDERKLPPYLFESWNLSHVDASNVEKQLQDFSTSSLSENFIRYQVDRHHANRNSKCSIATLSSMAIGSILDALNDSTDPGHDARMIVDSLSSNTLRQVINDPRLSYHALMTLYEIRPVSLRQTRTETDIDEVIMRTERFIRSRAELNQDGEYLVKLDQLSRLIPNSKLANPRANSRRNTLKIPREPMPKGGLEVLDYWRNNNGDILVNATDLSFRETFERITKGVLDGVDWSNLFMAGGMSLMTLLHTGKLKDRDRKVKDLDIDLYIYGLSSDGANEKVKHIYDVWSSNLPSDVGHLVTKNAKTITLVPEYPQRRIQIILELLPSPTDVLLSFDLDACAIGFDGSQVLMLPRFVRALETGFSVFSMDLVWGHHLHNRRATQENCIFKYANRGFGVRFLPSYARSLERDLTPNLRNHTSTDAAGSRGSSRSSHGDQLDRNPYGAEPGLKTLKRIAYLGKDFVHRFYFGATPLAISPQQYYKERSYIVPFDEEQDREWHEGFKVAAKEFAELRAANGARRILKQRCKGHPIHLSDLLGGGHFRGIPDGRRGLGNLEIFMRFCEAWALDACGDATLMPDMDTGTVYDSEAYDDIPRGPMFSIENFVNEIEDANTAYWDTTKAVICRKLNLPSTLSGFTDYSTRRVRRQVAFTDLDAVMSKQLTMPVMIPYALEDFILHKIPELYPGFPANFNNFPCLIPLYNPENPYGFIAPLPDNASESGNLRFWVITNETMWAGQHRAIDETFEVLWSLFNWMMQTPLANTMQSHRDTSSSGCIQHLARSFRRRIVLPDIDETEELGIGLPTKREARLFRPWALLSPITVDDSFTAREGRAHRLFLDGAIKYPFDDGLFWKGDKEELGEDTRTGKEEGDI